MHAKALKLLRRIAFSLLVLLALAGAAEVGYRLMGGGSAVWRMSWLETERSLGNCYSHEPYKRMPLDLQRRPGSAKWLHAEATALALQRGQTPPTMAMAQAVVQETPHCILYGKKREQGLFPRRKRKVLLLGDSFTFGQGLLDKETLGHQLGQRLKDHDMLNLGVLGVDMPYVARRFRQAVQTLRGQVDLAVYFFTPNDAAGLNLVAPPEVGELSPEALERELAEAPGSGLLGWSRLWRAAAQNMIKRGVTEGYHAAIVDYYRTPSDGMRRTLEALKALAQVSTDEQIPLLVVLYPFLYHDLWGGYPLAPVHRLMMAACEGTKVRCLDAHDAFAGERSLTPFQLNPADAHPNRGANQKVVAFMEAEARRMLARKTQVENAAHGGKKESDGQR